MLGCIAIFKNNVRLVDYASPAIPALHPVVPAFAGTMDEQCEHGGTGLGTNETNT